MCTQAFVSFYSLTQSIWLWDRFQVTSYEHAYAIHNLLGFKVEVSLRTLVDPSNADGFSCFSTLVVQKINKPSTRQGKKVLCLYGWLRILLSVCFLVCLCRFFTVTLGRDVSCVFQCQKHCDKLSHLIDVWRFCECHDVRVGVCVFDYLSMEMTCCAVLAWPSCGGLMRMLLHLL